MYQALYRKYRPHNFRDVAGQEHVTQTLCRQIVTDRLSHAYLFVGTRGTGKTSCAKILARAVNCKNPADGNPCNECSSCIGIENGSILDVLELDAASNNGVDNVRALREEAIYSPASVKKRVYIVDEVHMLSTAAFNALLKILEEPPEHLIFILATTELHKVPATILSRCQRFSFKRLSAVSIATWLHTVAESEGFTLTSDAANKLAALADGSMRDGLSLLDQCASGAVVDLSCVLDTIGLTGKQELFRLAAAVAGRDVAAALGILDSLYDDGRDMASLLSELAALIRDILIYKLSPDSPLLVSGFSRVELSGLSEKLSPERLFFCLDVVREAVYSLSRGGGVKLTVEMCLIRICDERLSDNSSALLSRITQLEENRGEAGAVNAECRMQNAELEGADAVDDENHKVQSTEHKTEVIDVAADVVNAECRMQNAELEDEDTEHSGQWSVVSSRETEGAAGVGTDIELPRLWRDILEHLRNEKSIYALLSDSARIQTELSEEALIIRAGDMFTVRLIEEKFIEPLRDAAQKTLGRNVLIRFEIAGGSKEESKTDKLESLISRFNIGEH